MSKRENGRIIPDIFFPGTYSSGNLPFLNTVLIIGPGADLPNLMKSRNLWQKPRVNHRKYHGAAGIRDKVWPSPV
jgi:hypothetical protein